MTVNLLVKRLSKFDGSKVVCVLGVPESEQLGYFSVDSIVELPDGRIFLGGGEDE